MAGYGYAYKGGYTTGYGSDHHHASQPPVAIDAEGRRKPAVISYTPKGKEYYVTKTEIVEHVPFVSSTGYKQTSSTPVRVEVIDYVDYHVDQGKWNRHSSSPEKWRTKPSSPVRVGYHPDHHDQRPQQVEEFITKIQTQASQQQQQQPAGKFAPLSPAHWRETHNFSSPAVKTGYGHHHQGDLSSKEWQKKPTNENFEVPYKRDHNFPDPTPKPSYGSWSKGQGANLGEPTSDINTAMQYLTEAAKPLPKRNAYYETIDSREAERRYGGLNVASRPPRDFYSGTIDSREAARKYGGTTV